MKKNIVLALIATTLTFWACERNHVEVQDNETEEFLSKIQNASLDEIYRFFGTTNSKRISILTDASHLLLVFPGMDKTNELIIIVEDEYVDNIKKAPRALFVNTQTNEVITAFLKREIGGNEWSIYITQDEFIGNTVNFTSKVLSIYSTDEKTSPCVNACMMVHVYFEWQSYLELGFFRRAAWWLGAPEMVLATYLDCMIDCL